MLNASRSFSDVVYQMSCELWWVQFPFLHSILISIADVLNLEANSDIISFEVAQFTRKFPNIPADLLIAILLLREDMGRAKAKLVRGWDGQIRPGGMEPSKQSEVLPIWRLRLGRMKETYGRFSRNENGNFGNFITHSLRIFFPSEKFFQLKKMYHHLSI